MAGAHRAAEAATATSTATAAADPRGLDWADLVLRPWRRYGHDRLYVAACDGHELGYLDNLTGVLHLTDEALRPRLTELLAWHRAEAVALAEARRAAAPAAAPAGVPGAVPDARKQRWNEGVARAARQRGTLSETALWHELERGSPFGWERERPWGNFRLDFYCAAARLAVEVDGSSHRNRHEADAARDAWFAAQGVETLRIPARDVERDAAAVVARINRRCLARGASVGTPVAAVPARPARPSRLPLLRRLLGLGRARPSPAAPGPRATPYTGRRLGGRFSCGGCRRELSPARRSRTAPGRCVDCAPG